MEKNIKEYYISLNKIQKDILLNTLEEDVIPKIHLFVDDLLTISELLKPKYESIIIYRIAQEYQSSILAVSNGLYRSSYLSLRLALEYSLSMVFYSCNKLQHNEWITGHGDINWNSLIDPDNGVLSSRYARAFLPETESIIENFNKTSKKIYRELSEYVHGNPTTWEETKINLKFNKEFIKKWKKNSEEIFKIFLFCFLLIFLKEMKKESIEKIELIILENLKHIKPIRAIFEQDNLGVNL